MKLLFTQILKQILAAYTTYNQSLGFLTGITASASKIRYRALDYPSIFIITKITFKELFLINKYSPSLITGNIHHSNEVQLKDLCINLYLLVMFRNVIKPTHFRASIAHEPRL